MKKTTLNVSFVDVASFHEGYVIHNQHGMFKVVDREVFSHANFTAAKNWGWLKLLTSKAS